MFQFPRFKEKYHVELVPDEGIYLISENEKHVLEGQTMFLLAPLLTGTRNWNDIVLSLASQIGEEALAQGMDILLRNGHLQNGPTFAGSEFDIYWNELGLTASEARTKLAAANLHIVAYGPVDPWPLQSNLQALGVSTDSQRPATMVVALVDDYQNPSLEALNRRMLVYNVPWLLLKPQGLMPLLGPVFEPGKSACHCCLDHWLKHNREVEAYLLSRSGRTSPLPVNKARIPFGEMQVVSTALLQICRWIVRSDCPMLHKRLIAIDPFSGEQFAHPVNRRPQCRACGDPLLAHRAGKPLIIEPAGGGIENENGLRLEEPDVTYQRYAHLISPLTGVVKALFPSPLNDSTPIKTYVAGHNFALKNDSLYFLKDGLRSNSSGKGRNAAQARTSALCEALERYCGIYRSEEEIRVASLRELGEDGVDPRDIMLYSEQQYRDRDQWNQKRGRFQVVPEPFDADARISWSPLWSWTCQKRKWVPTSLEYYGFSEPGGAFHCWADSNGCAAGGTVEDALLQGGLEVVERDCVALWWINRITRPRVDLTSFMDPYLSNVENFYDQRGRDVWVLDLTADLAIPCFAAINRRRNGPTEDIVLGFGAHFDAKIALNRAITEMNQFMPAVMDVGDDGNTRYTFGDEATLDWWRNATIANQPYLTPHQTEVRQRSDFLPAERRQAGELVAELFARFEAAGHEVLVLDQTRPDISLPVVKIIVPGMRHFWARHAPGRLYDVPVRLGWLTKPTAESDLNPIPMFV